MTGETKDKVLEIVAFADKLNDEERKAFITELLDHVCWKCGTELPKYDECNACGASRFPINVAFLTSEIRMRTDEERMEIFREFCRACGTDSLPCYCWNDE